MLLGIQRRTNGRGGSFPIDGQGIFLDRPRVQLRSMQCDPLRRQIGEEISRRRRLQMYMQIRTAQEQFPNYLAGASGMAKPVACDVKDDRLPLHAAILLVSLT